MELRGHSHLYLIRTIRSGSVIKVQNVDYRGRPALKFKKVEEIYGYFSFECGGVKIESECPPVVERRTISADQEAYTCDDGRSDIDSDETTLKQLKERCKSRKRKLSVFLDSAKDNTSCSTRYESLEDEEIDLKVPLISLKSKIRKHSEAKRKDTKEHIIKRIGTAELEIPENDKNFRSCGESSLVSSPDNSDSTNMMWSADHCPEPCIEVACSSGLVSHQVLTSVNNPADDLGDQNCPSLEPKSHNSHEDSSEMSNCLPVTEEEESCTTCEVSYEYMDHGLDNSESKLEASRSNTMILEIQSFRNLPSPALEVKTECFSDANAIHQETLSSVVDSTSDVDCISHTSLSSAISLEAQKDAQNQVVNMAANCRTTCNDFNSWKQDQNKTNNDGLLCGPDTSDNLVINTLPLKIHPCPAPSFSFVSIAEDDSPSIEGEQSIDDAMVDNSTVVSEDFDAEIQVQNQTRDINYENEHFVHEKENNSGLIPELKSDNARLVRSCCSPKKDPCSSPSGSLISCSEDVWSPILSDQPIDSINVATSAIASSGSQDANVQIQLTNQTSDNGCADSDDDGLHFSVSDDRNNSLFPGSENVTTSSLLGKYCSPQSSDSCSSSNSQFLSSVENDSFQTEKLSLSVDDVIPNTSAGTQHFESNEAPAASPILENCYHLTLQNPPERLLSTRKVITPTSQKQLCEAMSSFDLKIDEINQKAEGKTHFKEPIEDRDSSKGTVLEEADPDIHPKEQPTKSQVTVSFKQFPARLKIKNSGSRPKGILKVQRQARARPSPYTGCNSIQDCSQSAIAFSQRQMHDIESLAIKLTDELKSMKDILGKKLQPEACSATSSEGYEDEVAAAIKRATKVEESAGRWMSIMTRDCTRFCKIMKMAEKDSAVSKNVADRERKITFADEVGRRLCHVKMIEVDTASTPPMDPQAEIECSRA